MMKLHEGPAIEQGFAGEVSAEALYLGAAAMTGTHGAPEAPAGNSWQVVADAQKDGNSWQ